MKKNIVKSIDWWQWLFVTCDDQSVMFYLKKTNQNKHKLMTLVERSHNAVFSRVLWELSPGKLHRSYTPLPPPLAEGAKRITSSPNHALYISFEWGVFGWSGWLGGPDPNQWSKIRSVWIMIHQRNRWICSGHIFTGSFDAHDLDRSWIADPDPDHP